MQIRHIRVFASQITGIPPTFCLIVTTMKHLRHTLLALSNRWILLSERQLRERRCHFKSKCAHRSIVWYTQQLKSHIHEAPELAMAYVCDLTSIRNYVSGKFKLMTRWIYPRYKRQNVTVNGILLWECQTTLPVMCIDTYGNRGTLSHQKQSVSRNFTLNSN